MSTTIYLETGSTDPHYNLAFEEYVLTNCRDNDYLMLWQNRNAIIIGQNQNTEEEINREFVEEHDIDVVRRSTGGGAVYHDMGNLNYSFITDVGDNEKLTMERFTLPVVRALQKLGLSAEASGRNDILVEGRKVSGTAQRISKDRILHHGTLLFDSDPTMIAGALRADPSKFQSKSTKSVRSRVGNIRSFLPKDMSMREFWDFLIDELSGSSMERGALPEEELSRIQTLCDEKYRTWEWNYGRSPAFNIRNKEHFSGGILDVGASVENGTIEAIRFYGDFLSVVSTQELAEALVGCPYRREDISAVLDRFPLPQFFGSITKEEVLQVICNG